MFTSVRLERYALAPKLIVAGGQQLAGTLEHRQTTPLHLAMALLELPEVVAALGDGGEGAACQLACRHELLRLPSSHGTLPDLAIATLALMKGAERRAGAGLVAAGHLVDAIGAEESQPLGALLRGAPAAREALVRFLEGLAGEGEALDFANFSPAAETFFALALKQAKAARHAEVTPLHVLGAVAAMSNLEELLQKLGGTPGGAARIAARTTRALDALPRGTGEPATSLALVALKRRAEVKAGEARVTFGHLLVALADEPIFADPLRWPRRGD